MLNKNELVVNSSYKDFFLKPDTMRKDLFVSPNIDNLENLENTHLTRSLALLLKKIDKEPSVIYGIEIKSNGSERSSRIPLVRFSKNSISIWKVALGIESVEKAVAVLNDLFYFLEENSDGSYLLPKKILVLKEDESTFAQNGSKYMDFIQKNIIKNEIKIVSLDLLKRFIKAGETIDLEKLLLESNKNIFTTLNL